METIVERPGALDVHKAQVTAWVRVPAVGGEGREQHVAEFSTTVRGLLALGDWLAAYGVQQVVMEATGVFWKPVWHVLEDDFALLLVNARHVKQVPGRKTDVSDAAWLCQLLEAGLLKASFVPPKPIRALRNLTRYRKDPDPGAPTRSQPAAQSAGGHRDQAQLRRHRHPRRLGPVDARRAHQWHDRPRSAF
jgi:transposase